MCLLTLPSWHTYGHINVHLHHDALHGEDVHHQASDHHAAQEDEHRPADIHAHLDECSRREDRKLFQYLPTALKVEKVLPFRDADPTALQGLQAAWVPSVYKIPKTFRNLPLLI